MEARESRMIIVRRRADGTPTVWCDPDIADLVFALNGGGVSTVASCSGHGEKAGNIALADGRELIIAGNYEDARRIERMVKISTPELIAAADTMLGPEAAPGERTGNRISVLRKAAKLGQAQLAKVVGLSRSSIANIESGRQEMGVSHILSISRALGHEPSALISGIEEQPQ